MAIREQLSINVAKNVKVWTDFMDRERLPWCSFTLGPYPCDDGNNAALGLHMEQLLDKGYEVQVTPSVIQLTPVPTANGPVTIAVAIAIFLIKAPTIQLIQLIR